MSTDGYASCCSVKRLPILESCVQKVKQRGFDTRLDKLSRLMFPIDRNCVLQTPSTKDRMDWFQRGLLQLDACYFLLTYLMSMQDYVNSFRQLLSQQDYAQARQRLNDLVLELQTLTVVIPLLYPSRMKEFVSCRMDTGVTCSDIPVDQQPNIEDPSILVGIVVL